MQELAWITLIVFFWADIGSGEQVGPASGGLLSSRFGKLVDAHAASGCLVRRVPSMPARRPTPRARTCQFPQAPAPTVLSAHRRAPPSLLAPACVSSPRSQDLRGW